MWRDAELDILSFSRRVARLWPNLQVPLMTTDAGELNGQDNPAFPEMSDWPTCVPEPTQKTEPEHGIGGCFNAEKLPNIRVVEICSS